MVLKIALFILGLLVYVFLVVFFRKSKQWLPYYLLGAFGLTLILVLLAQYFGIERLLITVCLYNVSLIANLLEIPTKVYTASCLMVADPGGFSLLEITIECSAILEFSVLIGLMLFYPGFPPLKKLWLTLFGLGVLYVINVIRLMIIVTLVHALGTGITFIAHAVIGRLFFFTSVIILFWYIITRPTLKIIGKSVRSA